MKQQPFVEEMFEKIRDVTRLPTYDEGMELIRTAKAMKTPGYYAFLEKGYVLNPTSDEWEMESVMKLAQENREWLDFSNTMPFNTLFTEESIDELASAISELNAKPIVEICAGEGKASYHLRNKGVDIIATDNYSYGFGYDENLVEKLTHQEALDKYNPSLVFGSRLEFDTKRNKIVEDVFRHPSVSHVVLIDEEIDKSLPKEIYKGWERKCLANVEKYMILPGDFIEHNRHSCVSLFERIPV